MTPINHQAATRMARTRNTVSRILDRYLTRYLSLPWRCRGVRPPPNGSRLSCGRNARRRKEGEPQTKRLAGEATQFFPHERPTASSAC